jgi:vacuolar-type H+-ATPase subunit H
MDVILKNLLEAEAQAERLSAEADQEAQALVDATAAQTHEDEQAFEGRISELHEGFLSQAKHRAERTLGERQRRYHERSEALNAAAAQRETQALAAALAVLLRPE